MTDPRDAIERYAGRATALGVVFLVAAATTASAQPHGGSAGGSMGGWGAVGGWLFRWPVLLLGLLALLVVWAGSRRPGDRIDRADRSDRALEQLRERYARGELSTDEFERRRRNLQS
ncbi:SHOCT domain-containing protein [Natrinema thermotolerans]|uniref:SHOCT domain-containing protein n=1 Tax=Natrinema thermotolerans TaxID=121872 RepID=A0AAF0P9W6_9EURY|nr:SHOCT domain-containing protein [Natrinema thermotolerans]ELZ09592.1 Membrane protein-like protein [Natrinema thermotolerans DSM 11552]QCC60168.1 SHOCT domain-containing protein [Natrinema thermotolerans]QCC61080.1 SHOCT domain-containing protein [Natrinema thermotolerans]WMT07182.1 SHOCT domain-containing protein [Natrinema thermotolerans]